MAREKYTYAVARIRAKEMTLFSSAMIEQLISCKSLGQALQLLGEKGWGGTDTGSNADAILEREQEKIWETMRELEVDMSIFDVLAYPNLYHNLKAAIKEICTGEEHPQAFYKDCQIGREQILSIIREKNYQELPEHMREVAAEAYETLLHSRDGQLCDVLVDKATLDAIKDAGNKAKDSIIQDYAETTVAVTNIKIAVRCQKTGKSMDFMKQAMSKCSTLDIQKLQMAVLQGADAIGEYLRQTKYGPAADALAESPSAFERWCDNQMIETIRPQKYNPFTVGPLVAYVIARQNEIKTVRIILSCKQNDMPEDFIRERIREMYV